MNSFGKKMVK